MVSFLSLPVMTHLRSQETVNCMDECPNAMLTKSNLHDEIGFANKFIDEFDIELVNQALQFETTDCRIQGGCDLFSTRPAGSDKKLYKRIDLHITLLLRELAEISNKPRRSSFTRSFSLKVQRSGLGSFLDVKRRNSEVVYREESNKGEKKDPKDKDATSQIEGKESNTSAKPQQIPQQNQNSEDMYCTPPRVYDIVNQSPFGPLESSGSRKVFVYLIAVLNLTYPDHDFLLLEPQDFQRVTPLELVEKFNNTLISLGKMPMEWIWDTLSAHIDLHKCSVYYFVPLEAFLEDQAGSLWSQMWFLCNKKKKRVAYLYLNAIKRSVPISRKYYIGMGGKRRPSITIDDDDDEEEEEESFDEWGDEEALMSDIDEE